MQLDNNKMPQIIGEKLPQIIGKKLPQFIGICGKKHHGKTCLAKYLIDNFGYVKLSFADPLKEICKILFRFNDQQLNGKLKEDKDDRWNVTPRSCMQFVGTELMRKQMNNLLPEIEENIWIKNMELRINELLQNNPDVKIVIDDIRFQNEIELIKCFNSNKIILIKRNIESSDNHESEKNIDDLINIDHVLNNDGSINDLHFNFMLSLF